MKQNREEEKLINLQMSTAKENSTMVKKTKHSLEIVQHGATPKEDIAMVSQYEFQHEYAHSNVQLIYAWKSLFLMLNLHCLFVLVLCV
jgi:hypothetical protein